jgi:hypothetical protein
MAPARPTAIVSSVVPIGRRMNGAEIFTARLSGPAKPDATRR